MKVSILVPVYGVEPYIERCARSLFEQTYSDLEYVFVNDCTPDHSVEVLKRVMENYPVRKDSVRIIDHEKNRGIAATRNTALDYATGEFVSFVDSDDWLEPQAIELLVEKQQETGADIVSGNMYVHTANGVEYYYEPHYECKEQMIHQQFLQTYDHNAIRRIVSRLLCEEHNVRCIEGANMGEDRLLMVQWYWYASKVCTVDAFVYNYFTKNQSSITKTPKLLKKLDYMEQDLMNWIGIRDFFMREGENKYFEGTTMYMTNCIRLIMKNSLKLKKKDVFQRTMKVIDDNKDCQRLMGYQTEGAKGLLLHSFMFMLTRYYCQRIICRVARVFGLDFNITYYN